jgi:hypothetical protein
MLSWDVRAGNWVREVVWEKTQLNREGTCGVLPSSHVDMKVDDKMSDKKSAR